MIGKIKNIEQVYNFNSKAASNLTGNGGAQLGLSQMLSVLGGWRSMDGFKVETDKETYHILIDNDQSCCEDWGYLSSEDDTDIFVGAELLEVNLTDVCRNVKKFEEIMHYIDDGGIQFVDFVTNKGVFQLAVYNAHNGYYGHGILIIKGDSVIHSDTL